MDELSHSRFQVLPRGDVEVDRGERAGRELSAHAPEPLARGREAQDQILKVRVVPHHHGHGDVAAQALHCLLIGRDTGAVERLGVTHGGTTDEGAEQPRQRGAGPRGRGTQDNIRLHAGSGAMGRQKAHRPMPARTERPVMIVEAFVAPGRFDVP